MNVQQPSIYKICHTYDIAVMGECPAYIVANQDPTDHAAYLQFQFERFSDEHAVLRNTEVTFLLNHLYGFIPIQPKNFHSLHVISIDMHVIRAQRCGVWNATHFTQRAWVKPDEQLKLAMQPFLQRELKENCA